MFYALMLFFSCFVDNIVDKWDSLIHSVCKLFTPAQRKPHRHKSGLAVLAACISIVAHKYSLLVACYMSIRIKILVFGKDKLS